MAKNSWQGKKVLVTGGAGLVGSHLVERLLDLGAKVYVLDIEVKPGSYFLHKKLDNRSVLLIQDVRDLVALKKLVESELIEHIFHLAAQALVTEAISNPHLTLDTNVMGTVNVMEAARVFPSVKAVVLASSDKAYGKNSFDVSEDQHLGGDHPYDVSKSAADLIAQAYHSTFGLPVAVSRFGNIFGPGDMNADRIVPGIMESIILGKTLGLRSDGSFLRDYVYVKDVVDGYLALAENMEKIKGQAFNFSSGHNFSVLELIKKVSEILGQEVKYEILNNHRNEIPQQRLNWDKAKRELNWEPTAGLEEAVAETYDWYKQFYNSGK